jgi:hypothetical protein
VGNAKPGDLWDRKTKFKDLRLMPMELSYRYSNCKQKEIGVIFGVGWHCQPEPIATEA